LLHSVGYLAFANVKISDIRGLLVRYSRRDRLEAISAHIIQLSKYIPNVCIGMAANTYAVSFENQPAVILASHGFSHGFFIDS
jgi:hypothetical protein